MRILVADQDSELLESIARVFEVDVATSKATCIDLLRANNFDVVIATEKLVDGSGLELLSQVSQRWPKALRIFAIEPARRPLLKGRLGPFKLFDILAYPFDLEQLETVLMRAAASLGGEEPEPARSAPAVTAPAVPAPVTVPARPSTPQARAGEQRRAAQAPSAAAAARTPAPSAAAVGRAPAPSATAGRRMPAAQISSGTNRAARPSGGTPSAPGSNIVGRSTSTTTRPAGTSPTSGRTIGNAAPSARSSGARAANRTPQPRAISLPRPGSKVIPLGSPEATSYRILPHDYQDSDAAILRRSRREPALEPPPSPSIQEKAAKLVSAVMNRLTTAPAPRTPLVPEPAPRKKR